MRPISVEFPQTEKLDYLTTAGAGLIPKSTIDATCALYNRYLTDVSFPDMFDEFGETVEKSRRPFARWINARPEEISFQTSSSTSLNLVVSMSAPKKGENVVIDDLGFPSGTFPMMALKKRGVDVRWIRNSGGLITAKDYEKTIDGKTRLIVVSLVSWINGLKAEVEEITKLAHERGALCMVDSTHATGYVDIDVAAWNLDFLTTSNYKWLLSTHGSSEFFCAKRLLEEFEPPHLGWHSTPGGAHGLSAEDLELTNTARKFEPGNPDYISIFTLMRSLEFMARFGRARITKRTMKLSRMVNDGMRRLGLDVLTPDDAKHLSAITFACAKGVDGEELAAKLRKRGVLVTPRRYHGSSGIRISPYFYNDEEDVEALLEKTKEVLRTA